MRAADAALLLPQAPEACPMGLAPTTSTTMMLSLGDALAVALMERKGFAAERYRDLHPGGSLGRALIQVRDLMHGDVELPLVSPRAVMRDVIVKMTSGGKGFAGVAGVIDDKGALVGVITDGDVRRHVERDLLDRKAQEVMTANPRTVPPDLLAAEALAVMSTGLPRSDPACSWWRRDGGAPGRHPAPSMTACARGWHDQWPGEPATSPERTRYDWSARVRSTAFDAGRYTKFVRRMKRVLSFSAFAVIFAVLAFFVVERAPRQLKLSYDRLASIDNDLAMVHPRLSGVDDKGNPYVITAREAVQDPHNSKRATLKIIEADFSQGTEGWYNARAGGGVVDMDSNLLDLNGGIEVFTDAGYELHTASAEVNLKTNIVHWRAWPDSGQFRGGTDDAG